MPKIKYRLGLDLGANSLGWCVYRLNPQDEPDKIVRLGARIFADGRDPKTLASRAAERRRARQERRRRDRVLKRRHKLMQKNKMKIQKKKKISMIERKTTKKRKKKKKVN